MSQAVLALPTALPKKLVWTARAKGVCLLLIALGVAAFVLALQIDTQRAWADFLLNYFFWLCLSLAGVFFTALQHLTGSYWSTTLRRIPESFIAYLPVSLILFFVLLGGVHSLYEWSHPEALAHDAVLQSKTPYLNIPFFMVRHLALYLSVFVLGGWMVKNSLRQDVNGNPALTRLNAKLSAPFFLLFGWLFTFAGFDLLMSLAPHWYSTIFGIYCWSGLFTSGIAMIVLWVVVLSKKGYLDSYVNENHLHDLGKLMFAFLVFWAYIAFSQFMLIWYANLPEETVYMMRRVQGSWRGISLLLVCAKFIIPFFVLLSRPAKRNANLLLFMAIWFLAAQWLDIYWMVFPSFDRWMGPDAGPAHPAFPVFGWMEIGITLGFAGLFFYCVGTFLSKVSLVPIKDPRLAEALHHHQ